MPGDLSEQKRVSNEQEMFQIFFEISKLLNTGLDAESLECCIHLCECGLNPETLAKMVKDMKNAVKNKEKKLETKEASN